MADWKPTLAIDFDGVINEYSRGWNNGDLDGERATHGFFEWAESAAAAGFELVVYSSRSKTPEGIAAMTVWLAGQQAAWAVARGLPSSGGPMFTYASEKPAAWLTIDDRAIRFDGDWSSPELRPSAMKAFRPWNKRADHA